MKKDTLTLTEARNAERLSSETEPTTSVASTDASVASPEVPRVVTARCFIWGLIFTAGIAWFNCWLATKYNVHMVGGIQMPFGAMFLLMLFALGTLLLRKIGIMRGPMAGFTPTELLSIYAMVLFGALVSTPGCDNVFLVAGPVLFYFATPENGWATLFYEHIPSWFAPGWNGETYKKEVIDPIYLGNVAFKDIPWDAWAMMLIAWGIFLTFLYGLMFFTALLFRKQWTQREALPFPLVEVPVQMANTDAGTETHPSFWGNRVMWMGFTLAAVWHLFYGMNAIFPDWPVAPVNGFGGMPIIFTERPLNAIPPFRAEVFLGGIGLAYLLTREVSFSFWFFFLMMAASYAVAESLGYPVAGMEKAGISSRPAFITYQAVGGWIMMALLLAWTAREYLSRVVKEAFGRNQGDEDEPFSPRFMLFGFLLTFAGLIGWSWFAGINVLVAVTFFVIFLFTSIVLTRAVIEGGFMFPQPPFFALETMTQTMFGGALGAANLTKLGFLQPMMLVDMRTSVLPAFLHTMKIAEVLRLDRRNLRRLLVAVVMSLIVTVVVTVLTSLQVLYSQGGLAGYTWFSKSAAESTFQTIATTIKSPPNVNLQYSVWMGVGALAVYLMVMARSRFLWFPLHPLGYLMAPGYPITRLWFPFFLGWLIKTLIMKYGGSDSYVKMRPFMIGLILGNIVAMLFWVLVTFLKNGAPLGYWPA